MTPTSLLWGKSLYGKVPIISPDEIVQYEKDSIILIGSMYFDSIYKQLSMITKAEVLVPNFFGALLDSKELDCAKIDKTRTLLCDDKSRNIFDKFIKMRQMHSDFVDYQEVEGFQGHNRYWETIALKPNKATVIDCGAYTGDSIEQIAAALENIDRYYAFEPDETNYILLKNVALRNKKVIPVKKGVWKDTSRLKFRQEEIASVSHIEPSLNTGTVGVEVMALDDFITDDMKELYIKMDIEGAEMDALIGAKNTIIKRKPNLAICLYHKSEDIIEIPNFIKKLVPEYKISLTGGTHLICEASIE